MDFNVFYMTIKSGGLFNKWQSQIPNKHLESIYVNINTRYQFDPEYSDVKPMTLTFSGRDGGTGLNEVVLVDRKFSLIASFPTLTWTEVQVPVSDPDLGGDYQHLAMAQDLRKSFTGDIPADPTQVPIFNNDQEHGKTNITLNATKYFKCVQSKI